jgi:hypothetical protein
MIGIVPMYQRQGPIYESLYSKAGSAWIGRNGIGSHPLARIMPKIMDRPPYWLMDAISLGIHRRMAIIAECTRKTVVDSQEFLLWNWSEPRLNHENKG